MSYMLRAARTCHLDCVRFGAGKDRNIEYGKQEQIRLFGQDLLSPRMYGTSHLTRFCPWFRLKSRLRGSYQEIMTYMYFSSVEKSAEKATCLTLRQIKAMSPENFRDYLEKKNKKAFSFVSEFPVIGRGNVLRDFLISSATLNGEIDSILESI